MSNEIQLNFSLTIRNGSMLESLTDSFRTDQSAKGGPTPGQIIATTSGTDVDLSVLTSPGMCVVKNLDTSNFVEVGVRDPDTLTFYPLIELLPGEAYPIRLSRNVRQEYYPSTGTGTSAPTNFLHVKADTAACKVQIKAFER